MKEHRTFSLDELAGLTGATRRTVRYYIQEGLLDPPRGRGRAAVYTGHHLERLMNIRRWQNAGASLEHIRELREPEQELAVLAAKRPPGSVEVWSHLVLADGIELQIEPGRAGLSPEQIKSLARHVHAALQQIQEKNS